MASIDGLDIFARDFINEQNATIAAREQSEVQKFYEGVNVLITGATGFIGKCLVEKLLRTTSAKNLYLLVRPHEGIPSTQRIQDMFNTPVFRNVKQRNSNIMERVKVIVGDLTLPRLGLDEDDRELLIEEINIILHTASTDVFDTRLKHAIDTNVKGTQELLNIAKEMKQLKSFVHVSSAYSNYPQEVIEERVHTPTSSYTKLLELSGMLDDNALTALEPSLLGEHPNPYTFTKQAAENMIKEQIQSLPIAILRPGTVLSSLKEPVAGWLDNLIGPQGIVYSSYIGCQRVVHAKEELRLDIIPVDFAVNAILVLSWDVGTTRGDNPNLEQLSYNDALTSSLTSEETEIPVLNLVPGRRNPITWRTFLRQSLAESTSLPSIKQLSVPNITIQENSKAVFIYQLFYHILPAILFDIFYFLTGNSGVFVTTYRKLNDYSYAASNFSLREWQFIDDKTWAMWDRLGQRDKDLFNFDVRQISWSEYIRLFIRGLRIYVMGDDMNTLPEATQKITGLKLRYYIGWTITYMLVIFLLYVIIF